ncbi:Peripheral-type benzodiazepine receptor and related proteins [Ceraceosorus bombacis]|uniref:Peripheral-type benzodiazepine receptor and related proteins n=2 Tax=Ceraceosorus TaxID=401624 RepID=A0A0N7LB47_9BASI|nr:TspO/MBR-related protein [Ceraceosorus guamensis]PWN41574.1 TspO/MBR-related protein [Ceraceosorus guamensis]CEH18378.1 Peripheral-type benzodiazepine receptor and related proteins [Ceraceosorus bombacis]
MPSTIPLPPILIDIPRSPVFAVGLPLAASFATGLLTRHSKYGPRSFWYQSLKKPTLDPPAWSFGVVWPALYASMGWASFLSVKALDRTPPGLGRDKALLSLKLYYLQLALNQAWTPLCFGGGYLGAAFTDLVALTGTVGYWFYLLQTEVSKEASWFIAPYLAWTTYASYLNGSLWWNNSGKHLWANLKKKAD